MLGLPCQPACVQPIYGLAGGFCGIQPSEPLDCNREMCNQGSWYILLPSLLFSDDIVFMGTDMHVV